MKAERGYPRYTVTPKAEAAILRGHPWVYGEEVLDIQGETANGGLVDVLSRKGRYLGTGFLSLDVQDLLPIDPGVAPEDGGLRLGGNGVAGVASLCFHGKALPFPVRIRNFIRTFILAYFPTDCHRMGGGFFALPAEGGKEGEACPSFF